MQLDTDFTLIFGILAFIASLASIYQAYRMSRQPCAQCGYRKLPALVDEAAQAEQP
jgi:disulfide bond formation protein DsbB